MNKTLQVTDWKQGVRIYWGEKSKSGMEQAIQANGINDRQEKKSVIKLDCPPCRWGSRVYNALPRTALKQQSGESSRRHYFYVASFLSEGK